VAGAWQQVRVFVSSTFRDMQTERDHLVKVVFPELRERMVERSLHLIDVDLRWGVTEADAEQGKVLDVILREIEASRPFFVGLLGERYGSPPQDIPSETLHEHSWLQQYPGHSYTALEIIHGVLHNPGVASRSFFYFRDPAFIAQVPAVVRADYEAENENARVKVTALKREIHGSGRPVMEDYPCAWDQAVGRVGGLEAWGSRVLEDLWAGICAQYPSERQELAPDQVEREQQEAFAEERSRIHIGREAEKARLTEHVGGEDSRPVVVTGPPGCGKSALLASWYREYTVAYPEEPVFAYFVGATPDSTEPFRLLRNLCAEVKRRFDLPQDLPEDDKDLPDTLTMLLVAVLREAGDGTLGARRVVLLLDGLDQIAVRDEGHGLTWLPRYLPRGVRVIASTMEGDCLQVLRERGAEEIALQPLSVGEQREMVETILRGWGRKLDERQLEVLLAHPSVGSPLYLRVALEELRLFGYFERLTERITALPESVEALFDQVLERLERDYGADVVGEGLALLAASRYGLSEAELLDLLRHEGQEQFPRALWARLFRGARAYLVQRGELIGFFHRQLEAAVCARYPDHHAAHSRLADHFAATPQERRLDEWPWQLQQCERWDDLAAALSDLAFFEYAWNHDRKYEWMGYWRSLEGRHGPEESYQAPLAQMEQEEGASLGFADKCFVVARFVDDMGLYAAALPLNERALAIREEARGPSHPDVALSLNNLALIYHNQGNYAEALRLHERALAIYEQTLGPNHTDVALSLGNMAEVYTRQGNYEEASRLHRKALAIREQALGPNHPDVAMSLHNLALVYGEEGNYEEALRLLERAQMISEQARGPNHPDVALSLCALADLQRVQGNYAEALRLHERALAIREQALGPNHPDVAWSLNGLALVHLAQGNYEEASGLLERALAIRERLLGPNHPDVALSLNNLAEVQQARGNYAEALRLHERALAIWERALGPNHPNVAHTLNNLAEIQRKRRNRKEALRLNERALAIREQALGPNHPDVAQSLNNLALVHDSQGDYAEALRLDERALAILEQALGPNHPDVGTTLNNLALVRYAQRSYEEAARLAQRAATISMQAFGSDHPDTILCRRNLNRIEGMRRWARLWGWWRRKR
jgi:tetratricopeptide (TPR) repeat protein